MRRYDRRRPDGTVGGRVTPAGRHETAVLHLRDYAPRDEPAIHIARSVYAPAQRLPLHSHDFYELYLIEEGCLRHRLNGREVDVERGAFQMIRPFDIHAFEGHGDMESVLLNVAFSPAVYERLSDAFDVGSIERPQPIYVAPGYLTGLRERVEWVEAGTLSPYQFLAGLFVEYVIGAQNAGEVGTSDAIPRWLKRSMNAMESPDNLRGGIRRFVELSGRSQEHLTRSLKRLFGITPSAWINAHRVEWARALIRRSDRAILDISLEVGFQSESYFYRQYKAYFGVTPRAERARERTSAPPPRGAHRAP